MVFSLNIFNEKDVCLLLGTLGPISKVGMRCVTGAEARPGAVPRRDQGDCHGQDPPRERPSRSRQVQDSEGDPQGEHQAARRPV